MKYFLSLLIVLLVCNSQKTKAQNNEKPNVLFIILDDLNDTVEGLGGHPQAKTPNMDKLMKRGVTFKKAYANSPLCAPSRSSLLTSTYPQSSGVLNAYYVPAMNNLEWRKAPKLRNAKTFMEYFRDYGYQVHGTGKIFHNGDEDWSVWLDPITGKSNFGFFPSWGPFPWDGKKQFSPNRYSHDFAVKHPSFKDVNALKVFTSLADVPNVPTNKEKGIPGYNGWRELGHAFRYESEEDRDLMADELSAQWVVEKFENNRFYKPFMMAVGINRPHAPLIAPKKYFDMFPLDSIQLPPVNENDYDDIATIVKENSAITNGIGEYKKFKRNGYDKKWVQAYLACVAFADAQVGKILDALESSKYAKNTIVVLTSDHGYHMGEKMRYHKWSVWEEANRVPFIVAGKGIPKNEVCETPISLVDIYPTLLDYCNLPKNKNLEGHSIIPLLKNPKKGIWDGPDLALGVVGYVNNKNKKIFEPHYTARSKDFRYILCSNGEEELYNHKLDPYEWKNIANDKKYAKIKASLKEQVFTLIGDSKFKPKEN
tara:strand:+ start:79510 stop:81126 length:1617 start_codon:yes stop_codon:yes gene_type:complete